MKDIRISIALVTRNRPHSLERTLISLIRQKEKAHEVIISDDSNTDEYVERNSQLAKKYGCSYLKGPQGGLYTNRNFVARHCKGTHIRTMDDDHEFPDGHLEECMRAIEIDDKAIWTIGEYYPHDEKRPLPAPVPGQLHPRGFSYTPKNMKHYFGISCGTTIYPKVVVEKNILNVEFYKFGITYLEYGARLLKSGFQIKNLPTTYVIHHYDENNRSINSKLITDGARIFAMLMLSFHYFPTFKNMALTTAQLLMELFTKKISINLFVEAFRNYRISKLWLFER